MPVVQSSVEIAASQEEVFVLSQDYAARLQWDPFVREIKFLDGARDAAVGVKVWVKATTGLTMEAVYISLKYPQVIAIKMTRGPFFFKHFAGTWLFEASGPTTCKVTFRYNFQTRWLSALLNPIIGWRFRRDIEGRLSGLKHAVEQTDILAQLGSAPACC